MLDPHSRVIGDFHWHVTTSRDETRHHEVVRSLAAPSTPPERPVSSPLSPDQWQQLESLVDALLDTPPERRAALFAEVSGGDPARREELERLVAACERSYPLLDQPAAERFAALVHSTPVQVSQVVAGRYRITREVGRGGMAIVYLARDLKHDRDVALKVVRAELAAALGGGRFHREIQIAARLRHPHIVPVYDSGDSDGVVYYVMPYEEGPSLRERLRRDGALPSTTPLRFFATCVTRSPMRTRVAWCTATLSLITSSWLGATHWSRTSVSPKH